MARKRCCAVCDRRFVPEHCDRRRYKYCSERCAKRAKRERDKVSPIAEKRLIPAGNA
ncbi:MAG: hypothetical protein HY744_10940 [Deltaproteobacteria bacterium]|nr:hypothetical protein [Deltaproteobacteria bacterium]